ncbi:MAG TPA: hypothetical protein VK191_08265 [Symbiobacteriaceae bacterium]|nr:hypothetical protein [Symbiobacteriaceae bacterium]
MALSQREKALILIPVALGALIGFYSFVHEPLMAKRTEAESKLETVERDLKQGQRQLAQEGDLEARRVAVAAREEVVDASVPGKNAAALFVWYLSQAEMRSGGHVKGIKVADRRAVDPADPKKQVQALECSASTGGAGGQASGQAGSGAANDKGTAGQNAGAKAGGASGEPAGAQAPSAPNGATAGKSGSGAPCSQPLPPGSIVVISMELKLSGQFGQQLHFTQMLEEMPLFLANDQIALVRTAAPDWQKATGLITEGKSANAFNLLASSPEVDGSYTIQLYFKQAKVGPATSDMTFSTEAGRKDPFAQDGVAEFTQYVENAFNGRGYAPSPENPEQWIPTPEQLG